MRNASLHRQAKAVGTGLLHQRLMISFPSIQRTLVRVDNASPGWAMQEARATTVSASFMKSDGKNIPVRSLRSGHGGVPESKSFASALPRCTHTLVNIHGTSAPAGAGNFWK